MASRNASKRLIKELQNYQNEPNEALLELGPVDDDELFHWTALMKGVEGTAYEGKKVPRSSSTSEKSQPRSSTSLTTSPMTRWIVEAGHSDTRQLPHEPSRDQVFDTHLPSQRTL
jgi:hypothetical protein